jgi:hypothetical protein
MTEAEARDLLRDWSGVGGLEAWIAERRWRTTQSRQSGSWRRGPGHSEPFVSPSRAAVD